jgi:hypothetical protein
VESAVSTVALALVSICLVLRLRRSMQRSQRGGAHGVLADAGPDARAKPEAVGPQGNSSKLFY